MKEEKKDSIKEFIEKAAPYIKIILANWKRLLIINGIITVLSVAFLLLFVKNYYDNTITILPDYGATSGFGGLSGLAAMAGINVSEGTPTEIYQNLIESETVLKPVIYKKYKTKEFEDSVNLIEYFEIEVKTASDDAPEEIKKRDKFLQVVEKFNKSILTTNFDRVTSILTATIRTHEPNLSADVANSLAESLDEYIRTQRKTNASEQRVYLEERIGQVKDSLTFVENQLKNFREQNRIVAQSPQLLLEQGRLQRSLEIQQTVFIELTKQMELIKLDEIKDAPIVNIREKAIETVKKTGPSRLKYLIIIMFFIFSGSCLWFIYKVKINEIYSTLRKMIATHD